MSDIHMDRVDYLRDIEGDIRDALIKTHNRMADIGHDANSEEWRELHILTQQLNAMVDTIRLFRKHEYPPF